MQIFKNTLKFQLEATHYWHCVKAEFRSKHPALFLGPKIYQIKNKKYPIISQTTNYKSEVIKTGDLLY